MSERVNPYDNAKMESFFRTLKVEEVYNSKRLHSSLSYMSPEEFEYKFNNNKIRTRQLVLT